MYVAQNKLPPTKTAIRKVEMLAERYILLDSLLFKIINTPEKESALLAITEVCTDKTIMLYHSSLFVRHKNIFCLTLLGDAQKYLTISNKFFIPCLIHYFHSYIKGCHICQLACKDKPPARQLQMRINLNYHHLFQLSMDLKVMPRTNKGHRYILCIIGDVTNYSITLPIYHSKSEEIGDALIENVIAKYCIPEYIIMDQDSAFMCFLNKLFI